MVAESLTPLHRLMILSPTLPDSLCAWRPDSRDSPDAWEFAGRKTSTYRQIGNAFPPPVARAVGDALLAALNGPARPARGTSSNR